MKRRIIALISFIMVFAIAAGAAMPVFAEGTAPIAENFEIKTYRNVSVGGRLSACDPDGSIIGYEITTKPVKGELRISDGGIFIYSPNENKRGRDYFGYKAVDNDGNYSQEATVIIRIEKQKKDVAYLDMTGSADEYAAVALSEHGIFTGEQICGKYCFNPEKTVSRAEFLAMCMELSGEPIFTSVLSTGFSDDSDIDGWIKGYVATAAMCGAAISVSAEGERTFQPDEAISAEDAAYMLDSIMNLSAVSYLTPDSGVKEEAKQACMNLSACGVFTVNDEAGRALNRAEAAKMLISALELLNKRA